MFSQWIEICFAALSFLGNKISLCGRGDFVWKGGTFCGVVISSLFLKNWLMLIKASRHRSSQTGEEESRIFCGSWSSNTQSIIAAGYASLFLSSWVNARLSLENKGVSIVTERLIIDGSRNSWMCKLCTQTSIMHSASYQSSKDLFEMVINSLTLYLHFLSLFICIAVWRFINLVLRVERHKIRTLRRTRRV